MSTFLRPIEKPHGLFMRLAYLFSRWQFGKVVTPLKVHSARLPPAFGLFYAKVSKLDKKLTLPPEMILLIREQVARINVCLFCMDIGRSFTIRASMNEGKFDALDEYGTSPLFSDRERAALDYATELTKNKSVENYGGLRPGCWINAIPAGGIVLVPDATAGCQCSYLNRAWVALQAKGE